MARVTAAQRLAAMSKFWGNRAFRKECLDEAREQGILPRAINPDNLKAILDFLVAILPVILKLFMKGK